MSKRHKTFRFATNSVMVLAAVLPKLREFGYDTGIAEKLTDDIVTKGITLHGSFDGDIGVGYAIETGATIRIDDLLVMLKSDNFEKNS
jgi:hypothetical protein